MSSSHEAQHVIQAGVANTGPLIQMLAPALQGIFVILEESKLEQTRLLVKLDSVVKRNIKLGSLTMRGIFFPPAILWALVLSPSAISNSLKLKKNPTVIQRLDELKKLDKKELKALADSDREDAVFARFKMFYLNAFTPLIVIAFFLVLGLWLKTVK